jgi:hypothetical protein
MRNGRPPRPILTAKAPPQLSPTGHARAGEGDHRALGRLTRSVAQFRSAWGQARQIDDVARPLHLRSLRDAALQSLALRARSGCEQLQPINPLFDRLVGAREQQRSRTSSPRGQQRRLQARYRRGRIPARPDGPETWRIAKWNERSKQVRHSRQGAQANPMLFDYDAGPRHDLAERRHLVLHEAGEFGGRAADHLEPEIDQPVTHPRHADDLD